MAIGLADGSRAGSRKSIGLALWKVAAQSKAWHGIGMGRAELVSGVSR